MGMPLARVWISASEGHRHPAKVRTLFDDKVHRDVFKLYTELGAGVVRVLASFFCPRELFFHLSIWRLSIEHVFTVGYVTVSML